MLSATMEVMGLAIVGSLVVVGATYAPLVTAAMIVVVAAGIYHRSGASIRRALRSDVEQAKHEYATGEISELEFEKRLERAIDDD